MKQRLTIAATDGSGSFSAYVAVPEIEPAPAIVVIQEIFGVNKVMRDMCDFLAAEGVLAVCPDLFWRQKPGIDISDQTDAEWKQAMELFNGFNVDKGIEDLKATLKAARLHPAVALDNPADPDTLGHMGDKLPGKAGTLGFCLGGKLAYLMAARSDADCNVVYYGVGIEALLGEAANIKKPLLMHIAEKDGYVPPDAQAKIKAALAGNPNVTIYSYPDVDHAFARHGGKNYNKAASDLAFERTDEFLNKHL